MSVRIAPRLPAFPSQFPALQKSQLQQGQTARQTVDEDALIKQLQANSPIKITVQEKDDVSRLNGKLPTLSEVNAAFAEVAANPKIVFKYIYDGCYARAHLMAEMLNKKGINNSKLFAYGDLHASNEYMDASWWYHVAPIVFARNEKTGAVEMRVMDPSMANHPLKPEEWLGMMSKDDEKIDVTTNPQYVPRSGEAPDTNFDKWLPSARVTMEEYQAALDDIIHPGQEIAPPLSHATTPVRSVERRGDRVGVTFWNLAARFWVKPERQDLISRLQQAEAAGRNARIAFDPKTMELTHVG